MICDLSHNSPKWNKLAEKNLTEKPRIYVTTHCHVAAVKILAHFDEEISIFSNSSHLEWRAGLSDTLLKGNHPGIIPARFGLIWFSGFRGED